MARTACGSARCTCDHATCDLGWVTTWTPHRGQLVEAAAKCPTCFPPAESFTDGVRIVYAAPQQTDEADYPDARSAAAGDR